MTAAIHTLSQFVIFVADNEWVIIEKSAEVRILTFQD